MSSMGKVWVRWAGIAVFALITVVTSSAQAQAPAPAPAPPPQGRDGMRFRGAVQATGGGVFIDDYEAGMAGVEGRFGLQINNLIGVYVQPQLSFGGGTRGNATGAFGFFGVTGLADFTLFDRFFAGAGGGFTILNSTDATAGTLHLRAGAYPLMGRGENGVRRKGLMVGVDMRMHFYSVGAGPISATFNVMQLMVAIGYEAF